MKTGQVVGLGTIITALMLLSMATSVAAQPRASLQQTRGATLTIHNRSCPVEFPGPDFYGECHNNPIAGMAFFVEGPVVVEGTTDANGNVVFGDLAPGTYEVFGGPPGDFVRNTVYCAAASNLGIRRPFTQTGNVRIELSLAAADVVICDWYSVPENLRGEPVPPPPATVPSAGLPASLFAGGCPPNELGGEVAAFVNLAPPEGVSRGRDDAIVAATSASTIGLGFDTLFTRDHAIVIFDVDGATLVACGTVGGPLTGSGELIIGLRQVAGSGYSGIAFLVPSANQTAVSLFVARGLDNSPV